MACNNPLASVLASGRVSIFTYSSNTSTITGRKAMKTSNASCRWIQRVRQSSSSFVLLVTWLILWIWSSNKDCLRGDQLKNVTTWNVNQFCNHYEVMTGLQLRVYARILFFLIYNQKHFVGTQKNRLNETVSLNTPKTHLNWWNKEINALLDAQTFLFWTFVLKQKYKHEILIILSDKKTPINSGWLFVSTVLQTIAAAQKQNPPKKPPYEKPCWWFIFCGCPAQFVWD